MTLRSRRTPQLINSRALRRTTSAIVIAFVPSDDHPPVAVLALRQDTPMRRLLLALLAMALVLPLAPSATAEDFHIVRGEPAAPGAYPWMAAFLFDGGQGCGGSLIRPNWILTASHCVADDRGQPSVCLLYTSPSPRDRTRSRMPSSA